MNEVLISAVTSSLHDSFKEFLEIIYKNSITPELMLQFIQDTISLFQEINNYTAIEEQSLESLSTLVSLIKSRLLNIINRYSEFLDTEENELNNLQRLLSSLENLLKGFKVFKFYESFGLSQNILDCLPEINESLDLIVREVENDALIFPLRLRLFLKNFLNKLLQTTHDIIKDTSFDNYTKQEIEAYCRLINRTAISGIYHINIWNDHEQRLVSSSSQQDKQIELNQQSIQLLEFWIKEDQIRVLSNEELDETQLLMKTIDDHRERKLFSDCYS